ncbi:putative ubiquinol oxidase (non-electrogenic) [Helianthus annuus]|nr:putative ubiquinol oxidase (non-electrogenic) [Helianthus annuus]KAJ0774769.1 putative ubiquinol oxidase (non-electrogenic) [Helianthus annuus]
MMSRGTTTVVRSARLSEKAVATWWIRSYSVAGGRNASTMMLGEKEQPDNKETVAGGEKEKEVVSYWGVQPSKVTKEDGTEWKWNCFRPWETYQANMSIDLKKHHVPKTFLDKFAYWTVKSLRLPTDIFFQVNNLLSSLNGYRYFGMKCIVMIRLHVGMQLIC